MQCVFLYLTYDFKYYMFTAYTNLLNATNNQRRKEMSIVKEDAKKAVDIVYEYTPKKN